MTKQALEQAVEALAEAVSAAQRARGEQESGELLLATAPLELFAEAARLLNPAAPLSDEARLAAFGRDVLALMPFYGAPHHPDFLGAVAELADKMGVEPPKA